jgi:hypothetical protein
MLWTFIVIGGILVLLGIGANVVIFVRRKGRWPRPGRPRTPFAPFLTQRS